MSEERFMSEEYFFMEIASDNDGEAAVNSERSEEDHAIAEDLLLPRFPVPLGEAQPSVFYLANDDTTNDEDLQHDDDEHEEGEASGGEEACDKISTPVKSPSDKPHDVSVDEDGQTCTICFEPWTSSGEHRLVSLRCGHLFGRSCISKWLKGQGSRCPQCNARARKSEIRPIYARTLRMLDTSDRDKAVRQLEAESTIRKKIELEYAQLKLKYSMVVQNCDKLKKELMETQMLLNDTRSGIKTQEKREKSINSRPPSFTLRTCIELSGGCRVFDCCDLLGTMVISQPSSNPIFKGFGLKKVSLRDMRLCEYIHLHQKPIKDVSFHHNSGMVLTASLDKTVKITNCLNNSTAQTYNLDCEVWSCAWDLDNSCYFYAGVRTGVVNVFDIRRTDRCVEHITNNTEASPVISIEYMKRQANRGKCGPIVGHLGKCFFYEKLDEACFSLKQIPLEGKFTSLSYDGNSNHLLASCRPSPKESHVTHTLCEIAFPEDNFECNLVHMFSGGKTQAQLTRSKLVPNPSTDVSVLICASDEESKSALIWDSSTGDRVASLIADSPILDITSFRSDRKTHLATLTEKNLRIYNWNR